MTALTPTVSPSDSVQSPYHLTFICRHMIDLPFMANNKDLPTPHKKSILIPLGAGWLIAGMFFAKPLSGIAAEMASPSLERNLTFIMADVLRAGVIAGIGMMIIGKLRNRRWQREDEKPSQPLSDSSQRSL